jgi:hypothetical protein
LLFAPIITVVVNLAKRVPFVSRNPKLLAFVIAAIVGTISATHGSTAGIDWSAIAQCVGTVFAGSVATHEVANTTLGGDKTPDAFAPGSKFGAK